ncbi:MAG: proprotein convertase P-domain-containing protein [Verrucomicrobiales bacterium]
MLEIATDDGSAFFNYGNQRFSDSAPSFNSGTANPARPKGRTGAIDCTPGGDPGTFSLASQFGGRDHDGEWKLRAHDKAAGNTGSVTGWSLLFVPLDLPPIDIAVLDLTAPVSRPARRKTSPSGCAMRAPTTSPPGR